MGAMALLLTLIIHSSYYEVTINKTFTIGRIPLLYRNMKLSLLCLLIAISGVTGLAANGKGENQGSFGDVSKFEFSGKVTAINEKDHEIQILTPNSESPIRFTYDLKTKYLRGSIPTPIDGGVLNTEVSFKFKDTKTGKPLLVSLKLSAPIQNKAKVQQQLNQ